MDVRPQVNYPKIYSQFPRQYRLIDKNNVPTLQGEFYWCANFQEFGYEWKDIETIKETK
jgi:hypothetical protein